MPSLIRVVIADDQALVRRGFRMILEAEDDIEVAGEAATGVGAVKLVADLAPDVVLMDIRMPELDGLEATRRIAANAAATARVVILTTFGDDDHVYAALHAGASGFLIKDCTPERLIDAVRVVVAGGALLDPTVTRRLIADVARRQIQPRPGAFATSGLTAREVDVLMLLARGFSNAEIAADLGISDATVKTHVARVLDKIDARDRAQAVIYAYETGLVGRGDAAPDTQ
jgi:DNA-binding NarL/FixJ family response regulator